MAKFVGDSEALPTDPGILTNNNGWGMTIPCDASLFDECAEFNTARPKEPREQAEV